MQVKSRAGLADLKATVSKFSPEDYKRVFLWCTRRRKTWHFLLEIPEHVQVVPPDRLAQLAIDAGLVEWLEDKVA